MGQSRHSCSAKLTSDLPCKADNFRAGRDFAFVPRTDICRSSSKFVGNHLRRCGEPTRVQHVLFEDCVCSVNFNERYVLAPEIREVLKHALRIRLVQFGSFHYGMAQHQAKTARKVNIYHFNVEIDEPDMIVPRQFTTNTTIAAFIMDSIDPDASAFLRIVMQMEHSQASH